MFNPVLTRMLFSIRVRISTLSPTMSFLLFSPMILGISAICSYSPMSTMEGSTTSSSQYRTSSSSPAVASLFSRTSYGLPLKWVTSTLVTTVFSFGSITR